MIWLQGIWNGIKWLGGAVVAPLAKLRQVRGIGRIVRCVVHCLAVLLAVGLLLWMNYFFRLDTALRTPLPMLRMAWLPLLFLLVYGLCWLGWYVCRAIAAEEDSSPFPDIDRAWQRAMSTVAQAGVDVARTPLYLLIGRPQGETHDLIRAAGVPLATAPAPHNDDSAPLQVFANREAIYVSCADLSLLGRQAELFAQAARAACCEHPERDGGQPREAENADVDLTEIPIGPFDESAPVATATLPASALATHNSLSLVEEQVALLVDERLPETETGGGTAVEAMAELDPVVVDLPAALLKDAAEVEQITARLRHLCRLIVEERRPHVPLNGVLVLTPAAAADCDEAANHVGVLAQQDLQAIGEIAQVHCPHVVLVCDLETTPGGMEMLALFPPEQRARRLGVRLPDLTGCDAVEAGEIIDDGVQWLCERLLPPLVYRLIRSPQPEGDDEAAALRSNVALYRFLHRMRGRRRRLSRIVRRAARRTDLRAAQSVKPERGWGVAMQQWRSPDGLSLRDKSILRGGGGEHIGTLAGCYLVASGADSQREQGFAEAVFAQLPQLAHSLAWTDEIVRRDRRGRLLAKAGYAALAALAAALTMAAWVL